MSTESRDVELLIAPPEGWCPIDFKELWAYRELFGFMVWRDVSVRYKQCGSQVVWAHRAARLNAADAELHDCANKHLSI